MPQFERIFNSVRAIPLSNARIDCLLPQATLSDVISNDSIPLESFCALDPVLEKQRANLAARNHRAEVNDAIERQNKRLRNRPPEPLLRDYPKLRAIVETLNTIQNTRKRTIA